jgi:hypothetical protein
MQQQGRISQAPTLQRKPDPKRAHTVLSHLHKAQQQAKLVYSDKQFSFRG